MNKPYGVRSVIKNFPYKDINEPFYNKDGIEIEVKDGILYVGVDDKGKLEEAKRIARLYIYGWSIRQNIKLQIDFNHRWEKNAEGIQDHFLNLSDSIKVTDRVQVQVTTHQVDIHGKASIVTQQQHDSASFTNDTAVVEKALKDTTLAKVLEYYNEEIVNDDKPLYGIYKAIEVITNKLGEDGRKKLASLAGKSFDYIQDVMNTADTQRHANPTGFKKLTDEECTERAKILIDSYAAYIN